MLILNDQSEGSNSFPHPPTLTSHVEIHWLVTKVSHLGNHGEIENRDLVQIGA